VLQNLPGRPEVPGVRLFEFLAGVAAQHHDLDVRVPAMLALHHETLADRLTAALGELLDRVGAGPAARPPTTATPSAATCPPPPNTAPAPSPPSAAHSPATPGRHPSPTPSNPPPQVPTRT
jgi:hypothetical protein